MAGPEVGAKRLAGPEDGAKRLDGVEWDARVESKCIRK